MPEEVLSESEAQKRFEEERARLREMSIPEMRAELARWYRIAGSGPALTKSNIEWMQTLERAIENRKLEISTTPGKRLANLLWRREQAWREQRPNDVIALDKEIAEVQKLNNERIGLAAATQAKRHLPSFGGKTYKAMDAGSANTAKVRQVREMLGLQSWEDAGFLTGVYDETTRDQIGYRTSTAYGGGGNEFRFGPRNAQMGQRAGSFVNGRNLDMLTGMSVSEMKDFYLSLTPDELRKVQTELVAAGFYGDDSPSWGVRDDATEKAFVSMMITWADRPDVNLRQLLDELKRQQSAQLDPEVRKLLGTSVLDGMPDQSANITYTDADTLSSIVDTLSADLLGTGLDPGVKARLIAKLQDQEKAYKMNEATNRFNQDVAAYRSTNTSGGSSELEAFMEALIGQESDGNPNAVNARTGAQGLGQMLYWSQWAREAGADPGDFSAENQKRVIRYKLAQYYTAYGNWRDVAIAWYSGSPGTAWSESTLNLKQGAGDEPSMNEYADTVLGRMNAITQGKLANGATQPSLNMTVTEELGSPSARAEAELKALDPARYYGTRFYKGADVFFNMLRSPF